MTITTIFFDWGGVMARDSNVLLAHYLSKKYNFSYPSTLQTIWNIENKFMTTTNSRGFFTLINKKLGLHEPVRVMQRLYNNIKLTPLFMLSQRLAKYYKVGIISNQATVRSGYIRKRYNLQHFRPIVFSCEVGSTKPAQRIFTVALKRSHELPQHCLFIDNYSANIQTARKLGMKTILCKTSTQVIKDLKKYVTF